MYPSKIIVILFAVLLLCSPVLAANPNFTSIVNTTTEKVYVNSTSVHDDDIATPWWVWASAVIIGFVLFLYSFQTRISTSELERDAAISVMAWFPIAYAAVTSFNVSMVTGYGVTGDTHNYILIQNTTIYHFPTIGIAYAIFFIVALVNTFRILAMHKTLQLQGEENLAKERMERS